MIQISRQYTFDAAHRIEGHPKCGRLHGHCFTVEVGVSLDSIPDSGMVIDFGDLDRIVKPMIDHRFDHRYIVSRANLKASDPYAEIAIKLGHAAVIPIDHSTSECLAEAISQIISTEFDQRSIEWSMLQVGVRETPKSLATYFQSHQETK